MRKYYPTPGLINATEIDFLAKTRVTTKDEVQATLVDTGGGTTKDELVEYLGYSLQDTPAVRRVEYALKTLLDEEKITYEDK